MTDLRQFDILTGETEAETDGKTDPTIHYYCDACRLARLRPGGWFLRIGNILCTDCMSAYDELLASLTALYAVFPPELRPTRFVLENDAMRTLLEQN